MCCIAALIPESRTDFRSCRDSCTATLISVRHSDASTGLHSWHMPTYGELDMHFHTPRPEQTCKQADQRHPKPPVTSTQGTRRRNHASNRYRRSADVGHWHWQNDRFRQERIPGSQGPVPPTTPAGRLFVGQRPAPPWQCAALAPFYSQMHALAPTYFGARIDVYLLCALF
jgi:hypothetical protein